MSDILSIFNTHMSDTSTGVGAEGRISPIIPQPAPTLQSAIPTPLGSSSRYSSSPLLSGTLPSHHPPPSSLTAPPASTSHMFAATLPLPTSSTAASSYRPIYIPIDTPLPTLLSSSTSQLNKSTTQPQLIQPLTANVESSPRSRAAARASTSASASMTPVYDRLQARRSISPSHQRRLENLLSTVPLASSTTTATSTVTAPPQLTSDTSLSATAPTSAPAQFAAPSPFLSTAGQPALMTVLQHEKAKYVDLIQQQDQRYRDQLQHQKDKYEHKLKHQKERYERDISHFKQQLATLQQSSDSSSQQWLTKSHEIGREIDLLTLHLSQARQENDNMRQDMNNLHSQLSAAAEEKAHTDKLLSEATERLQIEYSQRLELQKRVEEEQADQRRREEVLDARQRQIDDLLAKLTIQQQVEQSLNGSLHSQQQQHVEELGRVRREEQSRWHQYAEQCGERMNRIRRRTTLCHLYQAWHMQYLRRRQQRRVLATVLNHRFQTDKLSALQVWRENCNLSRTGVKLTQLKEALINHVHVLKDDQEKREMRDEHLATHYHRLHELHQYRWLFQFWYYRSALLRVQRKHQSLLDSMCQGMVRSMDRRNVWKKWRAAYQQSVNVRQLRDEAEALSVLESHLVSSDVPSPPSSPSSAPLPPTPSFDSLPPLKQQLAKVIPPRLHNIIKVLLYKHQVEREKKIKLYERLQDQLKTAQQQLEDRIAQSTAEKESVLHELEDERKKLLDVEDKLESSISKLKDELQQARDENEKRTQQIVRLCQANPPLALALAPLFQPHQLEQAQQPVQTAPHLQLHPHTQFMQAQSQQFFQPDTSSSSLPFQLQPSFTSSFSSTAPTVSMSPVPPAPPSFDIGSADPTQQRDAAVYEVLLRLYQRYADQQRVQEQLKEQEMAAQAEAQAQAASQRLPSQQPTVSRSSSHTSTSSKKKKHPPFRPSSAFVPPPSSSSFTAPTVSSRNRTKGCGKDDSAVQHIQRTVTTTKTSPKTTKSTSLAATVQPSPMPNPTTVTFQQAAPVFPASAMAELGEWFSKSQNQPHSQPQSHPQLQSTPWQLQPQASYHSQMRPTFQQYTALPLNQTPYVDAGTMAAGMASYTPQSLSLVPTPTAARNAVLQHYLTGPPIHGK